jgi:hypothetical protein
LQLSKQTAEEKRRKWNWTYARQSIFSSAFPSSYFFSLLLLEFHVVAAVAAPCGKMLLALSRRPR